MTTTLPPIAGALVRYNAQAERRAADFLDAGVPHAPRRLAELGRLGERPAVTFLALGAAAAKPLIGFVTVVEE